MKKADKPAHHTAAGTQKHQANGPITWGVVFRRIAGSDGRQGEGVRAALAFAVAHEEQCVRWAESHPTLWAPATTAPPPPKAGKAPKAPKAGKAPKAPKAPKAGKAPRAPKAPKAPKAGRAPKAPKAGKAPRAGKAGEQIAMPEATAAGAAAGEA